MSRATSIAGVRPLGWLARLRAHCSCLAWACPAQLLGGWLGRCGAGANHGAGQGARDEHARQRSGARPRVVQTDTLHAPEACDSSEAAWERERAREARTHSTMSGMTLFLGCGIRIHAATQSYFSEVSKPEGLTPPHRGARYGSRHSTCLECYRRLPHPRLSFRW